MTDTVKVFPQFNLPKASLFPSFPSYRAHVLHAIFAAFDSQCLADFTQQDLHRMAVRACKMRSFRGRRIAIDQAAFWRLFADWKKNPRPQAIFPRARILSEDPQSRAVRLLADRKARCKAARDRTQRNLAARFCGFQDIPSALGFPDFETWRAQVLHNAFSWAKNRQRQGFSRRALFRHAAARMKRRRFLSFPLSVGESALYKLYAKWSESPSPGTLLRRFPTCRRVRPPKPSAQK